MTKLHRWKRGFSVLVVVVAVAGAIVGLLSVRDAPGARKPDYGHPTLFGAPPPCTADAQPIRRARRAEQQGHFYAERYPYEPQDGIQAVLLFQEARSCYLESGLNDRASRVESLADDLMRRIDVDYASSRLVLDSALASEKWALALAELRRLLHLTAHVKGHAYVEHLRSILGKVLVRANDPD